MSGTDMVNGLSIRLVILPGGAVAFLSASPAADGLHTPVWAKAA